MLPPPPRSTLFPYTTLFRSQYFTNDQIKEMTRKVSAEPLFGSAGMPRSEERFSRNAETDLVCRLLLEKKKKKLYISSVHFKTAHLTTDINISLTQNISLTLE